jgi:hypothetical protein
MLYGEERDMDKYNLPDGSGRYYASMPSNSWNDKGNETEPMV